MKNLNLIAHSILAVCYAELLEHARGQNFTIQYHVNEKEHSVSIMDEGPETIAVNVFELKQYLLEWITQYLKESKIVILYSCRDNACIGLDNPKDFTEDLSTLDDPSLSDLQGILYMAYDN